MNNTEDKDNDIINEVLKETAKLDSLRRYAHSLPLTLETRKDIDAAIFRKQREIESKIFQPQTTK